MGQAGAKVGTVGRWDIHPYVADDGRRLVQLAPAGGRGGTYDYVHVDAVSDLCAALHEAAGAAITAACPTCKRALPSSTEDAS